MSINGYTDEELVDGPQNGWMGYYSLSQQGVDVGDFEAYIDANAPVTFTDVNVSTGCQKKLPPHCPIHPI